MAGQRASPVTVGNLWGPRPLLVHLEDLLHLRGSVIRIFAKGVRESDPPFLPEAVLPLVITPGVASNTVTIAVTSDK